MGVVVFFEGGGREGSDLPNLGFRVSVFGLLAFYHGFLGICTVSVSGS